MEVDDEDLEKKLEAQHESKVRRMYMQINIRSIL
jgi:hypothetical protein